MFLPVFSIFTILISHTYYSSANSVFDFCVADFSHSGPGGYGCKDPTTVTVDNFVYSGLAIPNNNTTKVDNIIVDTNKLPGLNGMGVTMARAYFPVGTGDPVHTHRVSEAVVVNQGTLLIGFIDSNNTAYYKTLNAGEMMIIPHTFMHFIINVGSTPAIAYGAFGSEIPGKQSINNAFYGGNLPSDLVEKITLLDSPQVHNFKKRFGGTN
ncbi:Auxin-binding protein ABP19a [Bienertia sinuspersici]